MDFLYYIGFILFIPACIVAVHVVVALYEILMLVMEEITNKIFKKK